MIQFLALASSVGFIAKGIVMSEMLHELNQSTQPIRPMKVFNNWEVVPKGWYVACKSSELKTKKPLSKKICGHQIVVFRGESGSVKALDSFCPHMGMNFAKDGKVVGEDIRCHFHFWTFNGKGECTDIPSVKGTVKKSTCNRYKVQAYPVEEKYGLVWVYSDTVAPHPVFEIPELEGQEILYTHMKPFNRVAHPHITMMNSIDEQHMRTVHKLSVSLEVTNWEKGTRFFNGFSGPVLTDTLVGKIHKFFLGDRYSSSVLFEDGNLGLLTTGIDIKLFNRWTIPRGYFIFSHTFTEKGKNQVHPIVVTPKRKGLLGFLFSHAYLLFNKICMWYLAYQDGRVIYGNLRFRQDGLLAEMDGATAKWINFVNRVIEPSLWSRSKAKTEKTDLNELPTGPQAKEESPEVPLSQ
ncbi:MAG: Rieske 2Fe-2S domain-containing protein [Halobacteriovoraceae bacterium]|jgi:phenylpropionate dioxygenase-like ring-hydroxylating dioxygenase large terminal subunit|nr:Rieske 2Fe-2S domain-containing protein [Halobacteriovoraceae bacterium]MBT5096162.1 Rieske 2Fe-2S domain-containing protein [Halobacteriovoraceae bacterium]